MKRLFLVSILLFVSFFLFAEPNFLGIPFSTREEEVYKTDIRTDFEKEVRNILKDISKADVSFKFGSSKTLSYIHIECEYKTILVRSVFESYFIDSLKCKCMGNTFYNDEIIAVIYQPETDELHIDVTAREPYQKAFEKLSK